MAKANPTGGQRAHLCNIFAGRCFEPERTIVHHVQLRAARGSNAQMSASCVRRSTALKHPGKVSHTQSSLSARHDKEARAALDGLMVRHVQNDGDKLAFAEEQSAHLFLARRRRSERAPSRLPSDGIASSRHRTSALYCSTTTAFRIEGMDDAEAAELILILKIKTARSRQIHSFHMAVNLNASSWRKNGSRVKSG
jgi:hypothetical protein